MGSLTNVPPNDGQGILEILVHRCQALDTRKPPTKGERCDCVERISRTAAVELIQTEKADWLVADRGGKRYPFRNSIVIRQRMETALEIAADRADAHDAQIESRAKQKAIQKVVLDFRRKLTEAEEWTDAEIVQAFHAKAPEFLNGVGAKQKLLNATNRELADQPDFIREMGIVSRTYETFLKAALAYWNVLLKFEGLPEYPPLRMTDAPKSENLISGGYSPTKIALIDEHRQDNDDGHRKCGAANFRAGSGGSEMGVGGEIVPAPNIHNAGKGPEKYDTDQEARTLRNKWRSELKP